MSVWVQGPRGASGLGASAGPATEKGPGQVGRGGVCVFPPDTVIFRVWSPARHLVAVDPESVSDVP